jgi:hypothetical protein
MQRVVARSKAGGGGRQQDEREGVAEAWLRDLAAGDP